MTADRRQLLQVIVGLLTLGLLVSAPAVAGPGQASPTLTVDQPRVAATWHESFLKKPRSVTFRVSVSGPAQLRAFIRPARGGAALISRDFAFGAAGSFRRSLPLTARPRPGAYTLRVLGTEDGVQVQPVDQTVRIPAPATGIVDVAIPSAKEGGRRARFVPGPRNALHCRFHFIYPPKANKVRLVWKTPQGRFVGESLETSSTVKPYRPWVHTTVRSAGGLGEGRWWCYMQSLSGTVAKRSEPIRIR